MPTYSVENIDKWCTIQDKGVKCDSTEVQVAQTKPGTICESDFYCCPFDNVSVDNKTLSVLVEK